MNNTFFLKICFLSEFVFEMISTLNYSEDFSVIRQSLIYVLYNIFLLISVIYPIIIKMLFTLIWLVKFFSKKNSKNGCCRTFYSMIFRMDFPEFFLYFSQKNKWKFFLCYSLSWFCQKIKLYLNSKITILKLYLTKKKAYENSKNE